MGLLGKKKRQTQSCLLSSSSDEEERNGFSVLVCYDCPHLVKLVKNTQAPLRIIKPTSEPLRRFPFLFYNAISIELRDVFRMLRGMNVRVEKGILQASDINTFYEWFEGFFGVLTTIFDVQEDVIFSQLEGKGYRKMEEAIGLQRRKTKEQRTRDLCWDIFDLKMEFDSNGTPKQSLAHLLQEIMDEVEQLTMRVMTYFQVCARELPMVLEASMTSDERTTLEASLMESLKVTEPGKFVLCAISRGIMQSTQQYSFMNASFRGGGPFKSGQQKQARKYQKMHSDLVNKLAIDDLHIENSFESCSIIGHTLASASASSSSSVET